jgi:hypothetical protein
MSSFTAKYAIPVLQSADPVASSPTVMAALANRVDLLLGEGGQFNIASLAASTTGSQAITLARTYPGNNAAVSPAYPGSVLAMLVATLSQPNSVNFWVNNWLGSATTITGFTLNFQFTNAQTNRVVAWRYLPLL